MEMVRVVCSAYMVHGSQGFAWSCKVCIVLHVLQRLCMASNVCIVLHCFALFCMYCSALPVRGLHSFACAVQRLHGLQRIVLHGCMVCMHGFAMFACLAWHASALHKTEAASIKCSEIFKHIHATCSHFCTSFQLCSYPLKVTVESYRRSTMRSRE